MSNFLSRLFGKGASKTPPLYVLVPPALAARLGRWHDAFPAYDEVVGYSVLGHFFLRSTQAREYIVLHPLKKAAKSYGEFADVAAFEEAVLKDEGFQEYVLQSEHVAEIRTHAGALGPGEVYIPQPYPFLGGSGKAQSYGKGDAWVFANIVADMLEVGPAAADDD